MLVNIGNEAIGLGIRKGLILGEKVCHHTWMLLDTPTREEAKFVLEIRT